MNDVQIKLSFLANEIMLKYLLSGDGRPTIEILQEAYHLGIETSVAMMNKSAYKATCRKCGFEQTYLEEVPEGLLCGECAR